MSTVYVIVYIETDMGEFDVPIQGPTLHLLIIGPSCEAYFAGKKKSLSLSLPPNFYQQNIQILHSIGISEKKYISVARSLMSM